MTKFKVGDVVYVKSLKRMLNIMGKKCTPYIVLRIIDVYGSNISYIVQSSYRNRSKLHVIEDGLELAHDMTNKQASFLLKKRKKYYE